MRRLLLCIIARYIAMPIGTYAAETPTHRLQSQGLNPPR